MSKLNTMVKKFRLLFMNKTQYIEYLRKCGVKIGSGCDIAKSANFGSEPWLISIGSNVRITKGVEFITHDGGLWTLKHMGLLDGEAVKYGNITIGDNCNISWKVTIMPNVSIGRNSVIAAGALVTKDVPPGTVCGGVPAKRIETIVEYYEKVKDVTVPTFSMLEKEKIEYLKDNCPQLFLTKKSEVKNE